MKKNLCSLLILSTFLSFAQFINLGSTKLEVKKLQGEPKSIQVYDNTGEEIWSYGESGLATITFKNDKIKSFNNYKNILKIGESLLSKENIEKPISKQEVWKKLRDKAKNTEVTATKEHSGSITGLHGSGGQNIYTFPKEYEEMAEANGLNPYAMPDEITLQQMQKEYDRKKYLKWGLISMGIIGFFFLILKFKNKKK